MNTTISPLIPTPAELAGTCADGANPETLCGNWRRGCNAVTDGPTLDGRLSLCDECEAAITAAARTLAGISTPRRAAAARENGKRGGRPRKGAYDPTLHRDGTITYWSPFLQGWIHAGSVAPAELAAMSPEVRNRVLRHLPRS
jgi:hypothetical protein